MEKLTFLLLLAIIPFINCAKECKPSVTRAGGSKAPKEICSGDLIFNDDFDIFDLTVWQHELTLAGGGNWEFQWYTNNRSNSFVKDGQLELHPTLVADEYGEDFLSSGTASLYGGAPADECTNNAYWGCERTGTKTNYINPIKSARVRTVESFHFCYGKVEASIKVPQGDWLWPAFWLMPRYNDYGSWPSSGEIDLMESRGNLNLVHNGSHIGASTVSSTLHLGPFWPLDNWEPTFVATTNGSTFYDSFHRFQLDWTPDYIAFSLDDVELKRMTPTELGGFWEIGGFNGTDLKNPWESGTKMAPFDQQFYFIINLAVGGTGGFFPDDAINTDKKPWKDDSSTAMKDFWEGRKDWLKTWDSRNASLQVDYVKVWAL